MRSKNLVLSLLFIAMSVLFCVSILAASVGQGSNVLNIAQPRYSPGNVIDGILNISLKDAPNDYIRAEVDNKKFSMSVSNFLNAQTTVNYTCTPASCQSFYQETSSSPSQTYTLETDSKVLLGFKINKGTCLDFPAGVDIQQLSFDMTGSVVNDSYPVPSIDIGDDGKFDWQYLEPADTISAKVPSSYVITNDSMKANGLIKGGKYCERIKMPLASKFKLKANVTTDSGITLSIYDSYFNDETKAYCQATTPNFECEINKTIDETNDYYVCVAVTCDPECGTINSYSGTGNLKNGVLFDDNSFSTIPLDPPGDFPIDVYYAGYKPLDKTITVNSQKLREEAAIYLSNASNCNNASYCIIPLSISTTSGGNLILKNMNLQTNCIWNIFHDFSAISESKATINMSMTELQISVLNASSSKYGINTLTIRISDIFSKSDTFEIAKVPEITSLGPVIVAAGSMTNFTVKASSPKGNTIVLYDWKFGDGGTESTAYPSAVHVYRELGTFNLTLIITDSEGLSSSRTFTIISTSPEEAIGQAITTKKALLAAFTSQYSSIPSWYKPLFVRFDTAELSSILAKYENDVKNNASTADLITIKQKLDTLAIPQNIIDAVKVDDSIPIFSTDKISLDYLQKAGAGDYNVDNAEQIKELISNWQSQLGIKLSGTVKRVKTDIGDEDVATIVTIKLSPIAEVDSLYLIINLPSSVPFTSVKFESTAGKNLNGAIGFEMSGTAKTINLAIAGNQNINLLEVYGSPTFETLMNAIPIDTKCGNTKCDTGENSKTCPSDCPPIAKGITFIVLIIMGAGIGIFLIWKVYAAIYERNQEMKVFKNRNDLVSITMFIVNAKVRGMPEPEIREKLEKSGWNNEQIAFAFLKVEKRKKEIEKKIKEAKKLIEHK